MDTGVLPNFALLLVNTAPTGIFVHLDTQMYTLLLDKCQVLDIFAHRFIYLQLS